VRAGGNSQTLLPAPRAVSCTPGLPHTALRLCSKYKLMEQQLEEGRLRAKKKIPELEASLESLTMLEAKQVRRQTGEARCH